MGKKLKKVVLLFCCTLIAIGAAGIAVNHYKEAQEAVQVVSEKVLVPGGQSVGIKMNVKGVLVVGLEEIETQDSVVSPGYDAGIQIGDMILSINGQEVFYAEEVTEIIGRSGGTVLIQISRKDEILNFQVTPVKEYSSGVYKMGIWVKEKIAGIGTLSFYDPQTNTFAALGHGIYETKTGTLLEAKNGQLLKTRVKSIKEGVAGKPGEIRGIFYGEELPMGEVYKNCQSGIYSDGTATGAADMGEPMAVAYKDSVKEGPAYILTTIEGDKVEQFEIEITGVNRQKDSENKGLEIKVTDEKLLSHCGGIVQGMSGSPIIQDGKLVGAVTHVLVNDPTRGYGIFIENMLTAAS